MRQAYADAYNTQAKLICSYNAPKNMYALPEGNPILNAEAWGPQQRMGMHTDSNIPTEIESNAYTRDILTETLVGAKPCGEHRPLVYTLPKNTALEQPTKLESIMNVGQMQVLNLLTKQTPYVQAKLLLTLFWQVKFAKDICSILGVPFDLISGGYDEMKVGEKSRRSSSSKVFVTNMMTVCRHLELLLTDVYLATYGGSSEDISFTICAMSRYS